MTESIAKTNGYNNDAFDTGAATKKSYRGWATENGERLRESARETEKERGRDFSPLFVCFFPDISPSRARLFPAIKKSAASFSFCARGQDVNSARSHKNKERKHRDPIESFELMRF